MLLVRFGIGRWLQKSCHIELSKMPRDLLIQCRISDIRISWPERLNMKLLKCRVALPVANYLRRSIVIAGFDQKVLPIGKRQKEVNPLGRERGRLVGR